MRLVLRGVGKCESSGRLQKITLHKFYGKILNIQCVDITNYCTVYIILYSVEYLYHNILECV